MNSYTYFAEHYDLLMERTDYDLWTDYIEGLFKRRGKPVESILELACGTGNTTCLLEERGYDCTGIDKSESMLVLAGEKAASRGLSIPFLMQDMGRLEYRKKSDAVLCLCDGMNYMVEKEDARSLFASVADIIHPEGVFIFEMSSKYKLSKILGNNVFAENRAEVSYIWENFYDARDGIVEMILTLFSKEGEMYSKHEEVHFQRAYGIEELKEMLFESGFAKVDVYETLTFEEPVDESERITFVCEL